jgi:hypothetical protein
MRGIEFKIPHVKSKIALYKVICSLLTRCKTMVSKKPHLFLRMREEDRELIHKIAVYFDISEADVVKMAVKEFVKNHGLEVSS